MSEKNLAGFIPLDLEIVVHPQYAICQPSTTIGCSTSDGTTARMPREAALTPVQSVEPGRLSGRPTSSTIMPGGHIRARCPRPAGRMTQGPLTRTRDLNMNPLQRNRRSTTPKIHYPKPRWHKPRGHRQAILRGLSPRLKNLI